MDLSPLTQSIAHISLDWAIFVALAFVVAFDAMRSGSRRAVTLTLAFPLAVLALSLAESAAYLPDIAALSSLAQAVIACVLIFVLAAALYMAIPSDTRGLNGFITSALAGLAVAAVVVSFWNVLPTSALWSFGPSIEAIFGEPHRVFVLALALIALALARR